MSFKLKKIFFLILFFFVLLPGVSQAQNLKDAFRETEPQGGSGDVTETPLGTAANQAGYSQSGTFSSIIGQVVLAALSLLGVIFLILLIYAGYLWMTAAGNDQQVAKARSILITSIIGLVIVLSAYSISYFVLSSLQGETLQENGQ